jgi:hypothetical protein
MKIKSNIIRCIESLPLVGLIFVISCQKCKIPGKWDLISRTKYKVECIDFKDTTTGKHYGPMDYFEALFDNPNLYKKMVRVKFDTSLEKESFNSKNKNNEKIELNKNLSFTRNIKLSNTNYFLRGTYSVSNDTIILYTNEGFDNCKNITKFDTTDRIWIRCDSLDMVISIHSIIPNNPIIAKLESKDSLIFRDTYAFDKIDMIDYVFVKHSKKEQKNSRARKAEEQR